MEAILGRKKRAFRQTEEEREEPTRRAVEKGEGTLPVDPVLSRLIFIDWRTSAVLMNREATDALKGVVKECHPTVLEFLLDLITDRIMDDYALWSLRRKVRDMRDLGDYIYGET